MKRFLSLYATAAILIGTSAAHAEMSARELLELYDTGDTQMRELLETIVDGNSNGISWLNSYLDEYRGARAQVYCPPDTFTVDGPGMIKMMRTAIRHDPRYADLPYGATVMFSYIDHFPCP